METLPFKNPLGKPPKYTPEMLVEKFAEYLRWCQEHPIKTGVKTTYPKGGFAEVEESKPRLVSLTGFELFLGVDARWWCELKKRKRAQEYAKVKEGIKKYCETYQKEMASANIFNANIISRLLGLADKQEVNAEIDYKFKFGDEQ